MLADVPVIAMIPTKDMAKARKFYEDQLGLKAAEEDEGGITYVCGNGSTVLLYETYIENLGEQTVASWMVSDLRAEVDDLKSKGVSFVDYDMPELKTVDSIATFEKSAKKAMAAWFKDPDGNVLSLLQNG